jgi:hypothetical protein
MGVCCGRYTTFGASALEVLEERRRAYRCARPTAGTLRRRRGRSGRPCQAPTLGHLRVSRISAPPGLRAFRGPPTRLLPWLGVLRPTHRHGATPRRSPRRTLLFTEDRRRYILGSCTAQPSLWRMPDISCSPYARSVVVRTLPNEQISRRWALMASSSGASKAATMS